MWILRILNGSSAGKSYPLKEGTNIVGRAPNCDIILGLPSVSKQHAKIDLLNGKIILSDMNSRNGTFVDGIKISSKSITPGQKFAFHDVIIDVVSAQPQIQIRQAQPSTQQARFDGNLAHQMSTNQDVHAQTAQIQPQMSLNSDFNSDPDSQENQEEDSSKLENLSFVQVAQNYIDNVVLPGIYKILEKLELKWTLGLFVGAFIIFVTVMSAIPLMRILKDSIEQESRQRAETIAKTVALINKNNIAAGTNSALSVQFANNESGVQSAYIIDALDGSILAPSREAGNFLDGASFAHTARKQGKLVAVKQIDNSTIIAVVGIPVFNPETGANTNRAYSVVVYGMGQLAVDNDKTISLFIQTLFIALLVGAILFFFLYKIIVHPIEELNSQLDDALKNQSSDLETKFDFPQLKVLISNINSGLSRANSAGQDEDPFNSSSYDRTREMENLVQVIGFPALVIQADDRVIQAVNPAFEERTHLTAQDLVYGTLDKIIDQSLKLNITDLIDQVSENPTTMAQGQLDFNGESFDTTAQAIFGKDNIAYFIVVILPSMQEEEYNVE